jgi:hypothetical protein
MEEIRFEFGMELRRERERAKGQGVGSRGQASNDDIFSLEGAYVAVESNLREFLENGKI